MYTIDVVFTSIAIQFAMPSYQSIMLVIGYAIVKCNATQKFGNIYYLLAECWLI